MRVNKTNYRDVSLETFKKFKDVKVIVFDFDHTLYKYLKWEGYNNFFIKGIRKLFPELTDEEFSFYIEKYQIASSHRTSEATAEWILNLHGSTKEFVEFLKTVKFPANWKEGKIFPEKVLKDLSKDYKLYIVSNSSEPNVRFVSKHMGIQLKYFAKILSNQFEAEDLSKMFRLKEIIEETKVKPQQVLMVGDSIEYDLKPAAKLGFKTLLMED